MKISQSVAEDLKRLRAGRPGRRFRQYVRQRAQGTSRRDSYSRSRTMLLGVALIVVGTAIGWLPGPGGFLALVGLAVLATEIPLVARWLDYLELAGLKILRRLGRIIRPETRP